VLKALYFLNQTFISVAAGEPHPQPHYQTSTIVLLGPGFQSTLPELSSTPNNCLIVGKKKLPMLT